MAPIVLCIAVFLAAPVSSGLEPGPLPQADSTVSATAQSVQPDSILLERLQQLQNIARQAGPKIWPGWDPASTPIAIYKGNEWTVLMGHPSPPAGFRRLTTSAISTPVYLAGSATGLLHANMAQLVGGVLTSTLSW